MGYEHNACNSEELNDLYPRITDSSRNLSNLYVIHKRCYLEFPSRMTVISHVYLTLFNFQIKNTRCVFLKFKN